MYSFKDKGVDLAWKRVLFFFIINKNKCIYTMLREPLGVRCRVRRGSGGIYWWGWL